MSDQDIELWVYHRAAHEEPIEQAYKAFTAKMAQIDSPLGFRGLDLPPAPNCEEQLRCSVEFEHPSIPDLKFQIAYIDRSPAYKYKDRSRFDDVFRIGFKAPNATLDYKKILREEFSKVIEAFQAYRA